MTPDEILQAFDSIRVWQRGDRRAAACAGYAPKKFESWEELPGGGRLTEIHEKYPEDKGHRKA